MSLTAKENIFRIPNKDSTSTQWVQWHKDLVSELGGRANANPVFIYAWDKRGMGSTKLFGSNAPQWQREYLEKQGIKIEGSGAGYQKLTDAATNLFDFVGSALNLSTTGLLVGTGVLVALLLLLIYNIARNPIGSTDSAANLISTLYTRGLIKTK